ncbi:MAG: serine protease [Myxococcota bacterium]|nr:serine protease [Myxococcota bacterium]
MARFLWFMMLLGAIAPRSARADERPLPDRVDEWMDSVVLLLTGPAWCTGVVIDDAGTVATAYHCVAAGLKTEVRTRTGDRFVGEMTAADPANDLALLRVSGLAGSAPARPLREAAPRQGEVIYGLGHPFAPAAGRTAAMEGMLQWSISAGLVSNVGPRLIQTDAALNPGNSGGPAVDSDGRVVGIASRKLSGDNVAFLSSVTNLHRLVREPVTPRWYGGQVSLGLSSLSTVEVGSTQALMLRLGAIVRDRVVLEGSYTVSGSARSTALERGAAWGPTAELTAALRQRLGRGAVSTTLDAGGGIMVARDWSASFDADGSPYWTVIAADEEPTPALFVRVSLGGIGLRVVSLPSGPGAWGAAPQRGADAADGPAYLVALDFDLPGIIATF